MSLPRSQSTGRSASHITRRFFRLPGSAGRQGLAGDDASGYYRLTANRKMSLSRDERLENATLALRRMTEELGDRAFYEMLLEPTDPTLEGIHTTTFELLEDRGLVKPFRTNRLTRYELTARGWLKGIELLGRLEETKRRTEPVMAAMKDCVKGRREFVFKDSGEIVSRAGVSAGFMTNILECDFITAVLKRKSVDSTRRRRPGYLLKIPIDFGLELL